MNYAFTLDDLPLWPMSYPPARYSAGGIVGKIISALAKHNIGGVMAFSNSWPIAKHPEFSGIIDKWVEAGHHVANHTHSHIELNDTPLHTYMADIELGERHLRSWMSKAPARYFRHPLCYWGDTEEKVETLRNFLSASGYRTAEVTSWLYEWRWNRAYLSCVENGDHDGVAFVRRSFLDFSLAQLRYDDECAGRWFGRNITGITVGHPLPFFAEMADELLGHLIQNGVKFVSLHQAMTDPSYEQVASVPTREFLVYHQKLARASGAPMPMVAPEWRETLEEITRMGAGRAD
jgi:peptidoglycan-N-acetylglucosamine deacetylase